MAKSPISLLQELSIKQGYVPIYDYVGVKTDGIYNQFICRVDCKKFNAEGVGNTKKDAKQNAAKNMLLLLAQKNEISLLSPVTNKLQISTPTKICEPTSPSRMEAQPSPNHINYVGQLQELCIQQLTIKDILYEVVDESGPPHMRNFTIEVSVGSARERGTAQCKKTAKQEAAKKMLQYLQTVNKVLEGNNKANSKQFNKEMLEETIRKLGIEISECVISKPTLPIKEISKKAQGLYLKCTNRGLKMTRQDYLLKDLHNSFEKTYSTKISYNIRKKMQTVRDTDNADIIQEVVQDIEKALEVKIQKVILPSSTEANYMISLRLLSHPIITQCGMGETKHKAEIQAMYNVIVTVLTLLNIS